MFKKIPDPPAGWLDEVGTEKDWQENVLSLRKWQREQKIKAIKSLFRKEDYACDPKHLYRLFIPVVLSIILNRSYKDGSRSKSYECWQLTSWDHRQGYGDWSMMCLDFYPKTLEYAIYSDGECTM